MINIWIVYASKKQGSRGSRNDFSVQSVSQVEIFCLKSLPQWIAEIKGDITCMSHKSYHYRELPSISANINSMLSHIV